MVKFQRSVYAVSLTLVIFVGSSCVTSTSSSPEEADVQEYCAGVLYRPLFRICCGEVLSWRAQGQTGPLHCCGTQPYDPTVSICCADHVAPRASAAVDMCCGGEPYSSSTHICCLNRLSTRGITSHCCRAQPYNPTYYLCCSGVLTARRETSIACCGENSYNPDYYRCCTDGLVRFSSCPDDVKDYGNDDY